MSQSPCGEIKMVTNDGQERGVTYTQVYGLVDGLDGVSCWLILYVIQGFNEERCVDTLPVSAGSSHQIKDIVVHCGVGYVKL